MELSYHLLVGPAAAVLAGLFNLALGPAFAGLRRHADPGWREQTLASQLGTLLVYVLAGTAIGLLFWLSWGLTAIVGIPWWQRGIVFALLLWTVGCLPLLAIQLLALRVHWSIAVVIAAEWLITLMTIGLACAWTWAKAP